MHGPMRVVLQWADDSGVLTNQQTSVWQLAFLT